MATTFTEFVKESTNVWKGQLYAGNGGLPTDTPFHITGYDAVNIIAFTYNDDGTKADENGSKKNNRPLFVLTTDVDGMNIYISTFTKMYRDAIDVTKVHRCGGAVYDAWRKVRGQGLTNEAYLQKLVDVTKDAQGNQRPLKASYKPVRVMRTDGNAYDKELLSIDFAD